MKKNKVLYLTCTPHEVHQKFASSVSDRTITPPFKNYFELIKKQNKLGIIFPIIAFLYSLFLKIEENIVLVEGSGMLWIARFLKLKKPSLKIIYLDADLLFYDIIKKNKKPKIFRKTLKNIDGIISLSEKNKKMAEKITNSPVKAISPYPKEVRKIKIPRKNYALYVGRLDPEKNIKKIINFSIKCPHFEKLVIVGKGIHELQIKKIAENNKKIEYLGYLKDPEEISKKYSECKFFLNFSVYDSNPCTVMEAIKCKCYPIIPSHIGNSEQLDDIFIIDNLDDFARINEKINHILKNEKKAQKLLTKAEKTIPTKKQAINKFKKTFQELTTNLNTS